MEKESDDTDEEHIQFMFRVKDQIKPNTPKRIHPKRLLLSPKGKPVPSVDILSSTKAIAGLLITAVKAAVAAAETPAPTAETFPCKKGRDWCCLVR
ncbi:hypothetical protein F2Q68_00024809 [Brassica cretica]|nr:hypothetical protein F2Q68_00024809 [Brassica cretica]